jgi:hypothetical protein
VTINIKYDMAIWHYYRKTNSGLRLCLVQSTLQLSIENLEVECCPVMPVTKQTQTTTVVRCVVNAAATWSPAAFDEGTILVVQRSCEDRETMRNPRFSRDSQVTQPRMLQF